MIRPQYHVRRDGGHVLIWDVGRLVALAEDLPVAEVPLADIAELDEPYWFEATGEAPTGRVLLEHARRWRAADLRFPILLCAEGRLMDGMHRVLRALDEGRETIPARRLPVTPPPDHRDVALGDLPY